MCAPLLVAALSAPMLGEKVAGAQWGAIARRSRRRAADAPAEPAAAGRLTGALWAVLAVGDVHAVGRDAADRSRAPTPTRAWCSGSRRCSRSARACSRSPAGATLQAAHLPLMAGVGVCGALGQYLITVAFRSAPAATITPFEYTALVWGVVLDVAIWSVWPGTVTLLGGGDRDRRRSVRDRARATLRRPPPQFRAPDPGRHRFSPVVRPAPRDATRIICCRIAISAAAVMPSISTPQSDSSGPSSFQGCVMTTSP